MKLSGKDVAMYALFFTVIVMFVFLFFIFFKSGDSQTVNHSVEIPEQTTTIAITANYSTVNICRSDSGKAYVTYGQRITSGARDEISVASAGEKTEIDIKHKQSNAISGLWHSGAPVNVYLPPVNNMTVKIELKTGTINVENAALHQITCKTQASALKVTGGNLDRLNFQSRAGSFVSDGAKIAIADIKVNIGRFDFLHEAENAGFTLDSEIGAGLIFSDESLGATHPRAAIKYSDKIAGLNGADKISLSSNVALINITE